MRAQNRARPGATALRTRRNRRTPLVIGSSAHAPPCWAGVRERWLGGRVLVACWRDDQAFGLLAEQAAVYCVVDERGDDVKRCSAVLGDLRCGGPRRRGQRQPAPLSEAGALGGQPRRGRDHADQVALFGAQLLDEHVELILAGVGATSAVEHVCDGGAGLFDALRLVAERALRREREVVRRDPQPEPAPPVRKRAFGARVRARDRVFVNVSDALQVVLDGVPGVAELKLGVRRRCRRL
jgi:hypothetical protein